MHTNRTWDPGEALDPNFVNSEIEAKAALLAGDFSRWKQRGGHYLREDLTGYPERLFLFQLDCRWYVGWKTISDYVLDQGLPDVFCSRVYWHNVVGMVESVRVSDSDARVAFRPLAEAARKIAFEAITPLTELVHPFAKQSGPGQETTSPPDGWPVSQESAAHLSLGEKHIRRYTKELFKPRFAALTQDVLAYDPACSTGHFLAEFASLNPARIRTLGQDLSRQMIEYAKDRLERVYHGDAGHPAVAQGSVDILFCRFLNSEVVSTLQAREILPGLVETLCPAASLVMFGHSPVLLDAADLKDTGLRVLQTTARQDDYVFQYYVCVQ